MSPKLLWRERVSDLETPVGAYLKLAEGRPNSFLLESVEGGAARGRYSAIGMAPDLIWRARGGVAEVNRHALAAPHAFEPDPRPVMESLAAHIDAVRMALPPGLPSIAAGLFGYLGYDMVRHMERLPQTKPDVLGIPDAVMMRPTIMAVFDHVRDALILATPVWDGDDAAGEARLDEAEAALELMRHEQELLASEREHLLQAVTVREQALRYLSEGGGEGDIQYHRGTQN